MLKFYEIIKTKFTKKLYFSLKTRILVLIILPVIFYPLTIIYFNKFQDFLIISEFEAIERQGLTFSKTIGLLDEQYALIEKKNISGITLQTLLPYDDKNYKLQARLYDLEANLIADTNTGKVIINKLPFVEEHDDEFVKNIISFLYKFISRPIDLSIYKNEIIHNFNNAPLEIKDALNGIKTRVLRRDISGDLVLFVALPVKKLKLIRGAVLISSSGKKIQKELINLQTELFKILGIILFATFAIGIYLARSITNPINNLAKLADYIALNKILKLEKLPDFPIRKDEIGVLAKSFSSMVQELQNRVDHIANFAADVAHELKNPLTSLRSATETFVKLKKKKEQQQLLNIIQKDVERIDRLINDISLSSKLDAELIRMKFRKINLTDLVKTLLKIRQTSLGYKIELTNESEDLFVQGDETKLAQVLDNIINNAYSFSGKKGKIFVILKDKINKIHIDIEDNGPGFPNSALKKVFDRFYSERPINEEFGKHSGLGLSISKQIIEAHKGKITAENVLDKNKVTGARIKIILKKTLN